MAETRTRYCIIDPEKGSSLTLRLSVSQKLLAGSDFRIFNDNGDSLEKFKVSADDTKAEIRYLHTTVKNINRKVLAWQILCCSADPKLKDGIVELQILQADDTPCKMTEPAKWELDNIPPCSVNQPYKFSGKLVFIINTGGIEKSTI